MLNLFGSGAGPGARPQQFCDGLSRRSLLRIGSLAAIGGGASGGWSLPAILAADAAAGRRSSPKSVIMIYLVGGPPHQDMFDLKPQAPKEFAGPWRPVQTNVPGIEICEAFENLAKIADKYTLIRSLVGNQADHDAAQVFHGRDTRKGKPAGGWPQFGSMVSSLLGAATPTAPPPLSAAAALHPVLCAG